MAGGGEAISASPLKCHLGTETSFFFGFCSCKRNVSEILRVLCRFVFSFSVGRDGDDVSGQGPGEFEDSGWFGQV